MSAFATGVLLLVERVARRLLPLTRAARSFAGLPRPRPVAFCRGPSRRQREPVGVEAGRDATQHRRRARTASPPDDSIADDSADAAARILAHVFALHNHDRRTRGHSERVRAFAVMIGREMGLRPDQLDKLQWAALLHDIGKLKVPSRILNKSGRPTKDEWARLESHPAYGERLIAPLADWLGDWAGAITATPRAVGRRGLSPRLVRREHLPGWSHRCGGRLLRGDDGRTLLQEATVDCRRSYGAHSLCRRAVRPHDRPRLPQCVDRSGSSRPQSPGLGRPAAVHPRGGSHPSARGHGGHDRIGRRTPARTDGDAVSRRRRRG